MSGRVRAVNRAALTVLAVGVALVPACAGRTRPQTAPAAAPPIRIVFVGDSLVHRSAVDYGMLDAIRDSLAARHPSRSFEVVDAGANGDRIVDIRRRLDEDVLGLHPDAVVLYWDSDVSDVDESGMSPEGVRHLREAYEQAVAAVLQRLAASGAEVVMSGPTLIGERRHPRNAKDAQLDSYRDINRRLANKAGIPYLDTRHAFQSRRPPGAPAATDRGLLTEDGEHLNALGAGLARSLFVAALDAWLGRAP